jgi:dipeptidyl aminopeptidase/acylaminoacyl peptidase
MRWTAGSEPQDILPPPWNARTRVHEYGGRSILVANGTIWFSSFDDQRLYRMTPGQQPVAITPPDKLRYAACVFDQLRNRLLCIREDHRGAGEPRNTLVALAAEDESEGEVLFDNCDFVSAPCLSPDGSRVAFTCWSHPNMPWDQTSLWSARFNATGGLATPILHNAGVAEAVLNPQWRSDNQLYAISDRDNWWTLYQVNEHRFNAMDTGLAESEIGGPEWAVGNRYYHLFDDGRMLVKAMRQGVGSLVLIAPALGNAATVRPHSAAIIDFLVAGEDLFVINACGDATPELLVTRLDEGPVTVIRTSSHARLEPHWIPDFQHVSFPTGDGSSVSHGIYLPPTHPELRGPARTSPPLIVTMHGGPTAVSSPTFKPNQLYWTSRGFAVLDINYRGSTGYGRDYRHALYGQWGIFDVEDAVAGARWLAEQGLADPDRLVIRGGSAGGFTTLAALAFHDTFAAGASYYGISDIEALARDTHKFESRYLEQLIGPYPERADLYRARSPIHHLDGFNAPLLLLQGQDDPIVPPNQSEMIFAALRARGIPTAYIAFEGESHGFRKADNQIHALQAEHAFYARVLDLQTQEPLISLDCGGH